MPFENQGTTVDADRFEKGLAFQVGAYGERINHMRNAHRIIKVDKTLAALQMEYVVNPGVKKPKAVEFAKFEGAETIKVAVTCDLPPIDYVDAERTAAGFNTAILSEIGKRLKMNVELFDIDSGARASSLSSKRSDVVFWFQVRAGEEIQPDVPNSVILSESYYDWTKYLHIRKKDRAK